MSDADSITSTENEISVVRKIASRRLVGSAKRMNPVLALKAALPKAAELEMNMRLTVKEAKEGVLETQTMMEGIPEDCLLTILQARDGAQGLAGFDPQLLAALIEVQTTGQVSSAPAVVRAWTITDGQMCEPFIDRVFDVLELLLDADGRGPWFYGYRFARKVNDRRKLAMTLEETRYLFYACKVELGDGAKTGMMWLALPDSVRHATTGGQVGPENEDWQSGLRSAVLGSTVQLNAVLHRERVPLSWLMSLQEGQVMNIPGRQLEELVIEDSGARIVGTARLGQAAGQRAIRVTSRGSEPPPVVGVAGSGGGSPVSSPPQIPAASPEENLPPDLPGMAVPDGPPGVQQGLPDLPDLPAGGGLPGLPDLPAGLPDAGAAPGLPDLPDLPNLPALTAE